MKIILPLLGAGLMALAVPVQAEVSADILKAPGRSEAALAADAGRKPVELLNYFGVSPGMRVLDLMAGGGYYSELLAKAVGPQGAVVSFVNATPEDGDTAKLDAAWGRLLARNPNDRLEKGSVVDLRFKPADFDFALIHLEYHDFYWESEKYHYPRVDPDQALKRLYAAMKPGGVVGVVDHAADAGGDTRAVVDKLHRIDPAVVKADFQRAGFVLEGESDLLMTGQDDHAKEVFDPAVRGKTDRFVFRFRKPG
ncbi:Predicted methyltransferase [Sphingomonas laterariae]|uniref:Predicted methyltransferase n=1 Tax=Edaphosphingomonas laterariae TaxID=861865 RepID=A0A239BXM1_9SPHN|nr:methyltransferase domain-containing protein [Sphingomonas laterariae]SNS12640.1 Predicted methyltransferase [Sphingomonas laterariae]